MIQNTQTVSNIQTVIKNQKLTEIILAMLRM
jgi:hypothetical protein